MGGPAYAKEEEILVVYDKVVPHGCAGREPAGCRLQQHDDFYIRGPRTRDCAGSVGAQQTVDMRIPIPAKPFTLSGQVTAVEGEAYVLQEVSGAERCVAHDENTRIDRPANVGDWIEVFVDDRGRAILIQNIDEGEGLQ